LEALVLAGVAVVLGVLAGSGLGHIQVEVLLRGMVGMAVLHAYPWTVAAIGAAAILVVTSSAGWLLGRHAGGMAAGAALRSE
jgi:ABC-type antimicrobial peptide transport system permease subunit